MAVCPSNFTIQNDCCDHEVEANIRELNVKYNAAIVGNTTIGGSTSVAANTPLEINSTLQTKTGDLFISANQNVRKVPPIPNTGTGSIFITAQADGAAAIANTDVQIQAPNSVLITTGEGAGQQDTGANVVILQGFSSGPTGKSLSFFGGSGSGLFYAIPDAAPNDAATKIAVDDVIQMLTNHGLLA